MAAEDLVRVRESFNTVTKKMQRRHTLQKDLRDATVAVQAAKDARAAVHAEIARVDEAIEIAVARIQIAMAEADRGG